MLSKNLAQKDQISFVAGSESYYLNKNNEPKPVISMAVSKDVVYKGKSYKSGEKVFFNKRGNIIRFDLLGKFLNYKNKLDIKYVVFIENSLENGIKKNEIPSKAVFVVRNIFNFFIKKIDVYMINKTKEWKDDYIRIRNGNDEVFDEKD